MLAYCNNTECEHFKALEKPADFAPTSGYKAIFDYKFLGTCSLPSPYVKDSVYESEDFIYRQHHCLETEGNCSDVGCLYNNELVCTRDEIYVDKSEITGDYICKSFSNIKISGHRDWSSLLQSDGTAKGGLIDDDYARKMNADSMKYKSFGTHHRDSKEPKRKKGAR